MFIFIIHLHIYIYILYIFQNIAFQISVVFCLRFLVIHALRLRWAANSAGLADACMIWRLRQDAEGLIFLDVTVRTHILKLGPFFN